MNINISEIVTGVVIAVLSALLIGIGAECWQKFKSILKKWKERRKQNNFNVEDAIW